MRAGRSTPSDLTRIELAPQFSEVERPRETFSYSHLPEEVELLFKEALLCYASGALNAFRSDTNRARPTVLRGRASARDLLLFSSAGGGRASLQRSIAVLCERGAQRLQI